MELEMSVFIIFCILLWCYILTVFHRGKLYYFKFIWGSVGLFITLMILVQPVATEVLTVLVSSAAGIVGKFTGLYESYHEYGVLFIVNNSSSISLYIDYECSGVIEMMAFVSMLAFFQVYDISQRIIISIIGCVTIFCANVMRIFIICLIIYYFGNNAYYFAHTIIGRIFFYGASVAMYYYVFTKSQVMKQKVGGFQYEQHSENTLK